MTERGASVATAYYESGYGAGYAAGYARAEADLAALQRRAAGLVRELGRPQHADYATLCDRRGEPAAAECQRAILRERGIV